MNARREPAIPLTFLGTGNAFAPGRTWNSFLIGTDILVEAAPSALYGLRRAAADSTAIDVVFLSHFHADHIFGWPFLLINCLFRERRRSPLWVVGPPGVEERLDDLLRVGAYPSHERARELIDLRFVEVDEAEQEAGAVRFRAVRVEHSAALDCFGFVIDRGGRRIGYSGDTRLCDGLRALTAASDALVLECSEHDHPDPGHVTHMSHADVEALRRDFPRTPFILTHLDSDIDVTGMPHTVMAADFETLTI